MELELKHVTKDFSGVRAVDNLSFSLTRGVYGLLGVNGAGKTTLMRMLTTLLIPSSGSITWDGKDIFQMEGEYRKLLGYLPQEFGFYPEFSIRDYLSYIASIKGIPPMAARHRVKELLSQVGLTNVQGRKMKTLSGGMKRRAGIAQAMLNDPKILILDEPTAGLDPSERVRFRNLISELSEDRIVLLSTHIVSDVEYIAGEILLMKQGRIVVSGTSQEVIASSPERVWRVTVPKNHAQNYMKHFRVANIRQVSGGEELRILSGRCPGEGAVEEEATLEDAFLAYFGQKGGDQNDSL